MTTTLRVDARPRPEQDRCLASQGASLCGPRAMSTGSTESLRSWRASALAEPAFVRGPAADWLPVAPRLWLAWSCAQTREILGSVIGTPITISPAAPPNAGAEPVGFAVELRIGTSQLAITLDLPAARSLVDTLTKGLGGIRGYGPLSDGEQGILEFITLETLDRLIRRIDARPGAITVSALTRVPTHKHATSEHAVTLELAVGAAAGCVRISGSAVTAGHSEPSVPLREPAHTEVIELGLALAPILTDESELDAIEPGDCLLLSAQLSAQEGPSPWREAHVVTNTAWAVGRAEDTCLRSAVASARLADFDPRPHPPCSPSSSTSIVPVLGKARASTGALARLAPGAMMDFELDPGAPVRFWVGGQPAGAGELVTVDGQAAVRVLSWALPNQSQ